jgi:hypothetical protein
MDYSLFYPILGLVARGRLGTWFISKEYKTQRVIEKYHVPENPRTPRQQANRGLMYDAVYNWKHFDTNTKRYYNQIERPVHMSGYNRYIRLYLNATEPMITYWEQLERNADDDIRVPDYMASDYFAGIGRVKSVTDYPASPPYGAIRYRSDLKKFLGFKEDEGWGELGGGGGVRQCAFLVIRSTMQTNIPNNTLTKIRFNSKIFDLGGDFDAVTNNHFVAPVDGIYVFTFVVGWYNPADDDTPHAVDIYVNGSSKFAVQTVWSVQGSGKLLSQTGSKVMRLDAGDYVDIRVQHLEGASTVDIHNDQSATHFSGALLQEL